MEAACFAVEHDIDCVIVYTPPFFSIVRWLGDWPRTVLFDYGEPNPQPSSDETFIIAEKHFCFGLADRVYAISESVRTEAAQLTSDTVSRNFHSERAIKDWTWDDPLAALAAVVKAVCAEDGIDEKRVRAAACGDAECS